MIEFGRVFKRYDGGFDALKNISFRVDPGELCFITGHSGAGKTTLLKLITLIERPTRGDITVNRRNLTRLPGRRVPYFRRDLGIVFQNNKLLSDRTVHDNVALPLVVAGVDGRDIERRVRAALAKVGLLAKERAHPITLSGGEASRVGIARAIVHRPALLLADEPTGNLDTALADEILEMFLDFHRHGTTVVIASHDQRLWQRTRARVLRLDHGELAPDPVAAGSDRRAPPPAR